MFRKILFISLLLVFSNAATLTDVLDRRVEVKDEVAKVVLTFYFEEYFVTTGEEGVSKIAGWSKGYWKRAFLKSPDGPKGTGRVAEKRRGRLF